MSLWSTIKNIFTGSPSAKSSTGSSTTKKVVPTKAFVVPNKKSATDIVKQVSTATTSSLSGKNNPIVPTNGLPETKRMSWDPQKNQMLNANGHARFSFEETLDTLDPRTRYRNQREQYIDKWKKNKEDLHTAATSYQTLLERNAPKNKDGVNIYQAYEAQQIKKTKDEVKNFFGDDYDLKNYSGTLASPEFTYKNNNNKLEAYYGKDFQNKPEYVGKMLGLTNLDTITNGGKESEEMDKAFEYVNGLFNMAYGYNTDVKQWKDWMKKYQLTRTVTDMETGEPTEITFFKIDTPPPPIGVDADGNSPDMQELQKYWSAYVAYQAANYKQHYDMDISKAYEVKKMTADYSDYSSETYNSLFDIARGYLNDLRLSSDPYDTRSRLLATWERFKEYNKNYIWNPIKAGRFDILGINTLVNLGETMDFAGTGARAAESKAMPTIGFSKNRLVENQKQWFAKSITLEEQKAIMELGGELLFTDENLVNTRSYTLNDSAEEGESRLVQTGDKREDIIKNLKKNGLYEAYLKMREEYDSEFKGIDLDGMMYALKGAYTSHENYASDTGNLASDIYNDLLFDPTLLIGAGMGSITKTAAKTSARASFKTGLKGFSVDDLSKLENINKFEKLYTKQVSADFFSSNTDKVISRVENLSKQMGFVDEDARNIFVKQATGDIQSMYDSRLYKLCRSVHTMSEFADNLDSVVLKSTLAIPYAMIKTGQLSSRAYRYIGRRYGDLAAHEFAKNNAAKRILRNLDTVGNELSIVDLPQFLSQLSVEEVSKVEGVTDDMVRKNFKYIKDADEIQARELCSSIIQRINTLLKQQPEFKETNLKDKATKDIGVRTDHTAEMEAFTQQLYNSVYSDVSDFVSKITGGSAETIDAAIEYFTDLLNEATGKHPEMVSSMYSDYLKTLSNIQDLLNNLDLQKNRALFKPLNSLSKLPDINSIFVKDDFSGIDDSVDRKRGVGYVDRSKDLSEFMPDFINGVPIKAPEVPTINFSEDYFKSNTKAFKRVETAGVYEQLFTSVPKMLKCFSGLDSSLSHIIDFESGLDNLTNELNKLSQHNRQFYEHAKHLTTQLKYHSINKLNVLDTGVLKFIEKYKADLQALGFNLNAFDYTRFWNNYDLFKQIEEYTKLLANKTDAAVNKRLDAIAKKKSIISDIYNLFDNMPDHEWFDLSPTDREEYLTKVYSTDEVVESFEAVLNYYARLEEGLDTLANKAPVEKVSAKNTTKQAPSVLIEEDILKVAIDDTNYDRVAQFVVAADRELETVQYMLQNIRHLKDSGYVLGETYNRLYDILKRAASTLKDEPMRMERLSARDRVYKILDANDASVIERYLEMDKLVQEAKTIFKNATSKKVTDEFSYFTDRANKAPTNRSRNLFGRELSKSTIEAIEPNLKTVIERCEELGLSDVFKDLDLTTSVFKQIGPYNVYYKLRDMQQEILLSTLTKEPNKLMDEQHKLVNEIVNKLDNELNSIRVEKDMTLIQMRMDRFASFENWIKDPSIKAFINELRNEDSAINKKLNELEVMYLSDASKFMHELQAINTLRNVAMCYDSVQSLKITLDQKGFSRNQQAAILDVMFGVDDKGWQTIVDEMNLGDVIDQVDLTLNTMNGRQGLSLDHMRTELSDFNNDFYKPYQQELKEHPELKNRILDLLEGGHTDPGDDIRVQIFGAFMHDSKIVDYWNSMLDNGPVHFSDIETTGFDTSHCEITNIAVKTWTKLDSIEGVTLTDLLNHIDSLEGDHYVAGHTKQEWRALFEGTDTLEQLYKNFPQFSTFEERLKHFWKNHPKSSNYTESNLLKAFVDKYGVEGSQLIFHNSNNFDMRFIKERCNALTPDSKSIVEAMSRNSDNTYNYLKDIEGTDSRLSGQNKEDLLDILVDFYQTLSSNGKMDSYMFDVRGIDDAFGILGDLGEVPGKDLFIAGCKAVSDTRVNKVSRNLIPNDFKIDVRDASDELLKMYFPAPREFDAISEAINSDNAFTIKAAQERYQSRVYAALKVDSEVWEYMTNDYLGFSTQRYNTLKRAGFSDRELHLLQDIHKRYYKHQKAVDDKTFVFQKRQHYPETKTSKLIETVDNKHYSNWMTPKGMLSGLYDEIAIDGSKSTNMADDIRSFTKSKIPKDADFLDWTENLVYRNKVNRAQNTTPNFRITLQPKSGDSFTAETVPPILFEDTNYSIPVIMEKSISDNYKVRLDNLHTFNEELRPERFDSHDSDITVPLESNSTVRGGRIEYTYDRTVKPIDFSKIDINNMSPGQMRDILSRVNITAKERIRVKYKLDEVQDITNYLRLTKDKYADDAVSRYNYKKTFDHKESSRFFDIPSGSVMSTSHLLDYQYFTNAVKQMANKRSIDEVSFSIVKPYVVQFLNEFFEYTKTFTPSDHLYFLKDLRMPETDAEIDALYKTIFMKFLRFSVFDIDVAKSSVRTQLTKYRATNAPVMRFFERDSEVFAGLDSYQRTVALNYMFCKSDASRIDMLQKIIKEPDITLSNALDMASLKVAEDQIGARGLVQLHMASLLNTFKDTITKVKVTEAENLDIVKSINIAKQKFGREVLEYILKSEDNLLQHLLHNHQFLTIDKSILKRGELTKLKSLVSGSDKFIIRESHQGSYIHIGISNTQRIEKNYGANGELQLRLFGTKDFYEAPKYSRVQVEWKGISSDLATVLDSLDDELIKMSGGKLPTSVFGTYSTFLHEQYLKSLPESFVKDCISRDITTDSSLWTESLMPSHILGVYNFEGYKRASCGNFAIDNQLDNFISMAKVNKNVFTFANALFSDSSPLNVNTVMSTFFKDSSSENSQMFLQMLKENNDQQLCVLRVNNKNKSGFEVVPLKIETVSDLNAACNSNAVMLPYDVFTEACEVLNAAAKSNKFMNMWAKIVRTTKVSQIIYTGTMLRNMIDAYLKMSMEAGNLFEPMLYVPSALNKIHQYNKTTKQIFKYMKNNSLSYRDHSTLRKHFNKVKSKLDIDEYVFLDNWMQSSLFGGDLTSYQKFSDDYKLQKERQAGLGAISSDGWNLLGSDRQKFENLPEKDIRSAVSKIKLGDNEKLIPMDEDKFMQFYYNRQNKANWSHEDLLQYNLTCSKAIAEVTNGYLAPRTIRAKSTLDKLGNVFMSPQTMVEQTIRLAQYDLLEANGYTRSEIFKSITGSQFNYNLKSSKLRNVELFIPFFNFAYMNAMFWCKQVDENPMALHAISQIYTDMTIDNPNYSEDELGDLALLKSLTKGNIPIGDSGMYFKTSPSFMDAFNALYGGPGEAINRLYAPFQMGSKAVLNTMGADATSLFTADDLKPAYDGDWITNLSQLVPYLGSIHGKWYNQNKMRPWENLADAENHPLQQVLTKYFPSAFGVYSHYSVDKDSKKLNQLVGDAAYDLAINLINSGKLDYEQLSAAIRSVNDGRKNVTDGSDDFQKWQQSLMNKGFWYDSNKGKVVPLKEYNEIGLNDPNLSSNWVELCIQQLLRHNKLWDANKGEFVEIKNFEYGGLNRKFDFDRDGDWEEFCRLKQIKQGLVWDNNQRAFVDEAHYIDGYLNDKNNDWDTVEKYNESFFGTKWDANQGKWVNPDEVIEGGLNKDNMGWSELSTLKYIIDGEQWSFGSHSFEKVKDSQVVFMLPASEIDSTEFKAQRDERSPIQKLIETIAEPVYSAKGSKYGATGIAGNAVRTLVNDSKVGMLKTEDGKYILTGDKAHDAKVFDLILSENSAPSTGRGWRNYKWNNFGFRNNRRVGLGVGLRNQQLIGGIIGRDGRIYQRPYNYNNNKYAGLRMAATGRKSYDEFYKFEYQYNFQYRYHNPVYGIADNPASKLGIQRYEELRERSLERDFRNRNYYNFDNSRGLSGFTVKQRLNNGKLTWWNRY